MPKPKPTAGNGTKAQQGFHVKDRPDGIDGVHEWQHFGPVASAVRNLPVLIEAGSNPDREFGQVEEFEWENPDLQERAEGHIKAIRSAASVGLRKQALVQFRGLVGTWNENKAVAAVRGLTERGFESKVFCVIDKPRNPNRIAGPDWEWSVESLETTDYNIPYEHLRGLGVLKELGIDVDSSWIAKPHTPNKPALRRVAAEEAQSAGELLVASLNLSGKAMKAALRDLGASVRNLSVVMKDPVLLAGFGDRPLILVEVDRWE